MTEPTTKRIVPTAAQIRAARGFLGWSQERLALASGVSRSTVEGFEQGKRAAKEETIERLAEACERRGIVFSNETHQTVGLHPEKALLPV